MRTFVSRWFTAVALGLLLLPALAKADEQKIALDKLPKEVLDAVSAKFPRAELKSAVKETENGKTSYEVSFKFKGANHDVTVSSEGKITLVEKEISATDLPSVVAKALEEKHANCKITLVEEVSDGADKIKAYEITVVTSENKKVLVELDPQGKPVKK